MSVSDAAKEQLNAVSTATLISQLLKHGFRNTFVSGCVPLCPHLRLLGYAFTFRYAPAREDLDIDVDFDNETNVQRLAVEAIGPEEVLVIDGRGELGAASFGHILATRIKVRGAAGLVTDGALRDTPAIAKARAALLLSRGPRDHVGRDPPSGRHERPDRLRRCPRDARRPRRRRRRGGRGHPACTCRGDRRGGLRAGAARGVRHREGRRRRQHPRGVYPPGHDLLEEFDAG